MQRINGFSFYQLGSMLKPLENLRQGTKLSDVHLAIIIARAWLDFFLAGNIVPISFSKESGQNLLNALRRLAPGGPGEAPANPDYQLTAGDVYSIAEGLRQFQIVLNTELGKLDTYFISQTGIYSTPDLIESAVRVFSPTVQATLTDQIKADVNAAGRCLALELPTAAGFHIMRATEGVLGGVPNLVEIG